MSDKFYNASAKNLLISNLYNSQDNSEVIKINQ